MKTLLILSAASLLVAACATTEDAKYAQADCKVAPITTRSSTGVDGHLGTWNNLDQQYAQMGLSTSEYRRQLYAKQGMSPNNVEDTLRNCY